MNTAEAAIAGLFNPKGSGGGGSVAEAIISATSTTSPIIDSADGIVQGVTIYGRSEVVEGEIVSAGEGWSTIDLGTLTFILRSTDQQNYNTFMTTINNIDAFVSNSQPPKLMCGKFKSVAWNSNWQPLEMSMISTDTTSIVFTAPKTVTTVEQFQTLINGVILAYHSTQGNCIAVKTDDGSGIDGTMAVFETGTPLRGIPDTDVRDVMQWDGSAREVTKNCGEVDLGTPNYSYNSELNAFYTTGITNIKPCENNVKTSAITANYNTTTISNMFLDSTLDKVLAVNPNGALFIRDFNYTNPTDFKTAMNGVKLVYELAEPVTTPLTDAEISAFRALRTYDNTTNVTISDEPDFEIDYLKNSDNGQTVADIQTDLQGQINGLAIKTLTYTGTGNTTNAITFPDKPLMVLGYTQDSDYGTFVRGIMPFFFHPSTAMLRIFWKGKSETSHASDYTYSSSYVLTINGNSISWIGLDASQALNSNGVKYTVYYI